tara:strand:+ start:258 stop:389 length:132 start_codon:yes stop_codon:yes gene_type:complete
MRFVNTIKKMLYTYEEEHKYFIGTSDGSFKKRISEKDNDNLTK